MAYTSKSKENIGNSVVLFGVFLVLAALSIVAWQVINWLKAGYWSELPFRDLGLLFGDYSIPPPNLSWVGLRLIAIIILDSPMSLVLGVSGLVALWIGYIVWDSLD